ncbi:hypothetical protein QUF84_07615 [Fictibacillus enclensis]|uniref:hypothetical protein n=1 Tax=Fictibacillus enclensis TaxID=1017270 RepID=UPI0024C0C77A|nr:hypothetical protein [Fictibacillus enclensis]MDM5197944.1 hypothetical protein [Fictibacillus enclensis]MDM5337080.1 hypothetical protein [Fictibacillus enclensis]WHY73517.1 hypothetical protein QNH15_06285 [Fictibacillus enclensis]
MVSLVNHVCRQRSWSVGQKEIQGKEYDSVVGALQNCHENEAVVCRVNDDSVCVTSKEDIQELEEIGYKVLAAN